MHEHLNCDFEVKGVTELGEFEGYASTFGNVDLQGDKVVRGAFKRTITQHGGKVPVLWQHSDPIGVGLEAREDAKGLYVRGQLVLSVKQAQEARDLTVAGAIRTMSIGYKVGAKGWDTDADGIRLLKDIDLIEYSLVTFAANPQAGIARIKDIEGLTERKFEEFLRDSGFSHKEAQTIISRGYRALKAARDVEPDVNATLKLLENGLYVDRWLADQRDHILRG
jgi:HK97 family phage prohead protease